VPVTLSDEQAFFAETTSRYLAERAGPAELRRLRDTDQGFEADYWRGGAELGWTSLLVPEAMGGGALGEHGLVDLSLVATAFGRHAAPGPLVATNVVAAALVDADDPAHETVLAGLLDGSTVATPCDPAAGGGADDDVRVRADGDALVVDGSVRPVEAADRADELLVTGRGPDGLCQVLVAADSPGLGVRPLHSVDLTRRFAAVTFDGVRVATDRAVGGPDAGPSVDRQRRLATVLLCAESVGAMQTGFDTTVEWAFDRYTFGRPLASYQALKHRFADMATWLQAAHAITDDAASAVASQAPEADELLWAAKAFVGHYGSELLQDCVQLHGGMGLTVEHDLHLFLRRHTVDRALYGTPDAHRQRLGTAVLAGQGVAA
jgi:alkylation response protein AidB-like acyl-CoA dehydrogenase